MINILFGGNDKVFNGILLCSMSIVKHTKQPINIYILTADLTELNEKYRPITEENRKFLEDYLKQTNNENKVTLIKLGDNFNSWVKNSTNKLNQYTPFAFLRLFADQVQELPNKIIYLDTDIMLNGDINELFEYDLTNLELGVVLDRYGHIFLGKTYFNSGVLLMNLEKIRETNLFNRVKEMCLTKKMKFPDQTALNKCCKYKIYLPRKFNEQGNPRKDTVVEHFSKRIVWIPFHTINIKPWNIFEVQNKYKIHNYDDIFDEYTNLLNQNIDKKN